MTARHRIALIASLGTLALAACEPVGGCRGDDCGTLVIAGIGEPTTLLPPVAELSVARDIHDQVFLKLADIGLDGNTAGDAGFVPQLADRWTWEDSLTLAFHIDPRARWQDGRPVTAQDVAFTFAAYLDTLVNSPFRASIARIAAVTARDSATAVVRFRQRFPEMFYEAVFHVRVLPAHLLDTVPRAEWTTAPFGRAPVGDGPYRFVSWERGVSLELAADPEFFLGRPHLRRLVWRFQPDHPTAVTALVSGAVDALDVLVTPDNVQRARAVADLTLYPYGASQYGYLAFNLTAPGNPRQPHPIFGDRDVRRALVMAVDRERLRESVFGDLAKVPPGPIPTSWPLWEPRPAELAYDTAAAKRLLTERGWADANGDGMRERGGRPLRFHIMLPATSGVRRQYGRLLQEQFRAVGAQVELDEVEGAVHLERAGAGRFDALLGGWSVDPVPSAGLAVLWTRAAIPGSNHGRYVSAEFEGLLDRAQAGNVAPDSVRALVRRALEVFNADAPALALFAVDHVAAVHARVADVRIRGDSPYALLWQWRVPRDRLIDRDRVAPAPQ